MTINLSGKRILVTGGSGFIGTNLLLSLCNTFRCEVVNLDIRPPLLPEHAPLWRQVDVGNASQLRAAVTSFSPYAIVHAAARTDTADDQVEAYASNVEGTRNVLYAFDSEPAAKRLVLISSQFVVGPGAVPASDEVYAPHTAYGESKARAEDVLRSSRTSKCWTILRPTNVWGPWHPRYPSEFWRVLGRGLYLHPAGEPVVRCYGYVGNVVCQLERALVLPEAGVCRRTYYVGDEQDDIRKWVDAFSRALTGRPVRVVPRSVLRAVAYGGDALERLGRQAPLTTSRYRSMTTDYRAPMGPSLAVLGRGPVNLEEGVRQTVMWLRTGAAPDPTSWRD